MRRALRVVWMVGRVANLITTATPDDTQRAFLCHGRSSALKALLLGREHIAVPALVEHPPGKEAGDGAGGQVPGQPCGLTNLPRGQSIGMLAEEGNNDATALLHIGSGAVSPETVLVIAHTGFACLSPSQPFKPRRIGRRVHDGMLNIPVPQVVLNEPRVRALVGEGEAACMAEHMRVRIH